MEPLTARDRDQRLFRLFKGQPVDRIPVCPRVFQNVNPYCNIVDDRDIPTPAFGPIEIPLTD